MLGVEGVAFTPGSVVKFLWENTGGAFVDGLMGNTTIEQTNLGREENIDIGTQYCYEPLPQTGDVKYMRLLKLLPGSPLDDVKCWLETVMLGNCPDYEALSYCWRDVNDTTPIQVNEQTLYITKTLRSALFHLRKVDHVRTLWVDAICINQNDIEERGNQVGIMGGIYSGANRTVVWLGPRDEDSDSAFVICAQVSNEAQFPVPNPKSSEVTSTASLHAEIDKNYGSVLNLLKRPWWRRVWVVQEVVLAKKALIVCGTKEMEWELFSLAIEQGISLGIWQEMMLGLVTVSYFSFYKSITTMKRSSLADSTAERLLSLMIHVREREATDPRDKVFAILGLLHGDSKDVNITPDYASPPPDVFRATAVSIIKQTHHHSHTRPDHLACDGLRQLDLKPREAKAIPLSAHARIINV